MKNILSAKQGFTLSEILISLQIFSLLVLFVYAANRIFYISYLKQVRQLNNLRQTSQIEQIIREKLNQADHFEFANNSLLGLRGSKKLIEFKRTVMIKNNVIDDSLKVKGISADQIDLVYKNKVLRFTYISGN
ncbi:MAG: prepilin-type N-terminal cleavage/methylation domain-containing protein [Calditrichaeota bacterium]|nr:prepilin-type N-terminal cleavage/methylation domain-containing protein [Calditrichota bacterium]